MSLQQMKYHIILFFLLFSFANSVLSQNFWGKTTTSSNTNEAIDVETDASGNSYVAGYYTGGTNFDNSLSIASQGANDIYVAKYDPSGSIIWLKHFGGTFSDRPSDLALDNQGNIFITGEYFGQIVFGITTLNSVSNSKDIFLVKLDNAGNVVWAKSEGGTDSENAFGITLDGLNNVILTGQFKGTSQIASQTVNSMIDPTTSAPNFDIFIAKYNASGLPQWLRTGQAKNEDRGLAVACDAANNIFLTGQFSDTMIIASTTINNAALSVGFVAKFSPTGTLSWLNQMKAGYVVPYDIEVNSASEPVIIGDFSGTMLYLNSTGNTVITSPYSKKIFTLKISNAGAHIWNKVLGSDNELSARSLSIDAAKNIYVTGFFRCNWTELHTAQTALYNSVGFRDAYLYRLNDSGNLDFAKTFGSQMNDEGEGVAINNQQQAIICGTHTQILNIPVLNYLNYNYIFNGTITPLFSFFNYTTSPQNHVSLYGDLSSNSFLTNALHGNTPNYNFFTTTGLDSLNGFIEPYNQDTIHFCSSALLYYNANTNNDIPNNPNFYGPSYEYTWSNGATTNPLTISQSGTYYLNIERIDGCASGGDTMVGILESPPPLPNMTDNLGIAMNTSIYPDYNFCAPDSISISYSNLCTGCDISIVNGNIVFSDTLPHYYSQGGYYTVIIENEYCLTSDYFLIDMDSIENFNAIDPYLYFFNDTDQNDTINMCIGEWLEVHVYDEITNPNAIPLQFFEEPTAIYLFDVSPAPLSYLYLMPANEKHGLSFLPSNSGWYTFNYSSSIGYANSCGIDTTNYLVTDSVFIQVSPNPIGNSVISAPDLLCPNDTITLTVNPVYPGLSWQGNSIIYTSPNNDSIRVTAGGDFSYVGNLIDPITGCSSSVFNQFTLIEKQPPNISLFPADGVICPGDSVDFWIPDHFVSYYWVGPSGGNLSNSNTYTDNQPGFYYCQVIDSNGCSLTTPTVEVNEYTSPNIYAEPQSVLCDTTSIVINVNYSDNAVITWINPIWAGNLPQISVNSPGTYICQIQQCGISTLDTIVVTNGAFNISISTSDTILCYGDTAVILVPAGYTVYEWSSGQVGQNSISVTQAGQYSVSVTNQFGCETFSDTIQITTVPFSYPPNIPDTAICEGDDVLLVNPDGLPINWYDPSFNFLTSNVSFPFTNLMFDTVVYAAYNVSGCAPAYQEINVASLHPFAGGLIVGDTTVCANDTSILSLNLSPGTIQWFLNNQLISTGSNFEYVGTASASVQQVMAIIVNSCFSDTVFQNMYTLPPTSFNLSEDSVIICGNANETIFATSTFEEIVWTTPQGSVIDDEIEVSAIVGNGNFVYAQGLDSLGCYTPFDSILVLVPSSPSFSVVPPGVICLNDTILLNATTTADSLIWFIPSGSVAGNPIEFVPISETTIISITAYGDYACPWVNYLTINSGQSPIDSSIDTIDCFTDWLESVDPLNELLFLNENGLPIDSLTISDLSWYTFTAVSSITGCAFMDSVFILSVSCTDNVPNVFTPNGDGVNDYFIIDNAKSHPNNELIVLNRWGNVVFEMEKYDNSWDGGELHDGVYFYIYYVDNLNPSATVLQGTIHLFGGK